jgi:hypothetical protein
MQNNQVRLSGSSMNIVHRSSNMSSPGDHGLDAGDDGVGVVVDSLVKFRSTVRQRCVDGLSQVKAKKKMGAEDSSPASNEEAIEIVSAALKGVLSDCDSTREELLRERNIEIKDLGNKSTWSFRHEKL